MLEYLKTENNRTLTENDAVTLLSSGSDVLDLFSTIGAMRNADENEVIARFIRAYSENQELAMKTMFFARDVRGGLGERKVFRTIMHWLAENHPQTVIRNFDYIAEFGRYDDYLIFMGTKCEHEMLKYLKAKLVTDLQQAQDNRSVSLLAKWLPSVNASNAETIRLGKKLAHAFGMTEAEYRKTLSGLRKRIDLIENHLREADYSFEYSKVPSRAQYKYRQAFLRNDNDRYRNYILSVNRGIATMHADHIAPYEFITPFLNRHDDMTMEEKASLNAIWNSLPDYGGDKNILAVIDTSGSMYWGGKPIPAAVALSLGLYFAERNKGVFHNHFIEFSERPQLLEIKGKSFAEKLQYIMTFNEVADTNLEAVFELILTTAVKYEIPQEELPSKLVIISDMEFNQCVRDAGATNFRNAKALFEAKGYVLPEIVFWNVASRNRQQPVKMNEQGVALVSGCSIQMFEMIAGGNLSPYEFMLEILESKRYAGISA